MIVACLKTGKKQEIRQFGTSTRELKEMANWLQESKCQKVAMESTGNYWRPIYNVLEVLGLEVIVVNASHMKTVPGRKTDMKDAEWIADLLKHGLLKPSFIPDKEQRELRDVSRYRKSLIEERARELNRLEKNLENSNIKLSSVLDSVKSKTAKRLINGAIEETINEETINEMVFGSAKGKISELLIAMEGVMSPLQKQLVKAILDHIDDMTMRIKEMDDIVKGEMLKYEESIAELDKIPGIAERSAQTIIAEIGTDMSRFPTADHLASWAGVSPGNNESAGKRKSSKTCKGNKTLKHTLIQCAQAAVKKKETFFRAQYDKLVVRRGANRAKVAVAHSMLISIWHMLKKNVPYFDLGRDYYNKFNVDKKISSYLKKLLELGWDPPVSVLVG
jgi:transposase